MQKFETDTIAAPATAIGEGAVSIIRVSGKEAFNKVAEIFGNSEKFLNAASHTITYGNINMDDGTVLDDVLLCKFVAPNSYTGEDVVEINCHGSFYIVEQLLSLLYKKDVRPAEPGEFTKRAFLNSKLDLSQAEAVADVINSRSMFSLKGARNQLDGMLSKKVESLRSSLLNTSSLLELELDFAEEDLEFMPYTEVENRIQNIISELSGLISSFSFGKVIRDGVNVALVGKPNVGKSSLLNYVLKESRAIVSNIPGTTRDVISEEVIISGILYKFHDTAGIRLTEDMVEQEGVNRSITAIKNADIVLFINEIFDGISEDLFNDLLGYTTKDKIITVFNKIDLDEEFQHPEAVKISATEGIGIDALFNELKKRTVSSTNYSENSAIVTNKRHVNSLEKAVVSLDNALTSIEIGMSGEYLAVDLRNAESALGEIIGTVTTDDILNNIFSKFCIGK